MFLLSFLDVVELTAKLVFLLLGGEAVEGTGKLYLCLLLLLLLLSFFVIFFECC